MEFKDMVRQKGERSRVEISLLLPTKLNDEAREVAETLNCTKSEFIRACIRKGLDEVNGKD